MKDVPHIEGYTETEVFDIHKAEWETKSVCIAVLPEVVVGPKHCDSVRVGTAMSP